jgi:hypothetical protein
MVDPTEKTPGAPDPLPGEADLEVAKSLVLGAYVDRFAPPNFTEEAKSQLLYEVKEYIDDLNSLTGIQRRADGNAEKVLRRHVADSAASLRRKSSDPADRAADWCKWIGFTWLGLTIGQYIHIQNEKNIASGSMNWFAADLLITVVLLAVAAVINRPWGYFTDRFRKK